MTMADDVVAPLPAQSCPATRLAMRKGIFVRWLLFLIGLACFPLTVVLIDIEDRVDSNLATLVSLGINLAAAAMTVGLILGGVLLWINRRRRKALQRYPWSPWPVNYLATGRYEWVQLLDQHRRPVSTLTLSTWPRHIGKLVNHKTSEIWFAGDPMKYGVVSRPGGGDLRYAYRSRSRTPPRFTFRATDSSAEPDSNASSRPQYQLIRERGHTSVQPVGEPRGKPKRHGAKDDDRYPSPRMLRRALAFIVDWVLHVGCGVGAALAVGPGFSPAAIARHDWQHLGVNPVAVIGFFLAASAFDRVVFQAIFHTTVGKALFGLVVIRPQDGTYPSFGRLLAVWLCDLYLPIGVVGGGTGPDELGDYFLPAVRRRDVAHRRTGETSLSGLAGGRGSAAGAAQTRKGKGG
ncbi:RDD family protein [Nocardia brasiliensis]|uniref:RDD family protein n=1 Tax=Nocardia brasiliensis TaxID=37326 RepID=UPI0036715D5D